MDKDVSYETIGNKLVISRLSLKLKKQKAINHDERKDKRVAEPQNLTLETLKVNP